MFIFYIQELVVNTVNLSWILYKLPPLSYTLSPTPSLLHLLPYTQKINKVLKIN